MIFCSNDCADKEAEFELALFALYIDTYSVMCYNENSKAIYTWIKIHIDKVFIIFSSLHRTSFSKYQAFNKCDD